MARTVCGFREGDPLTTDTDITQRRWLPIELDPVRPSGISATDEEHAKALARTIEIRGALRDRGWPEPIVADSGNGGHLLYRIDLPSNDDGIVKRCLQASHIASMTNVVVDQSVFNPARIWKLYGTLSREGDNLSDRPHRLARILELP